MRIKAILIATAAGLSASVSAQQARPPLPKAPADARPLADPESPRARQQRALRSNGLRAAAAVSGSFVSVVRSHPEVMPRDLEQLVNGSHLIVVGTVLSHRSYLDERERAIHTSYDVQVETAWKGPGNGPRQVTVSIPGGRVGFPDGTWAQMDTPEMPLPINGQRYVFFLEPARHEAGAAQRAAARGLLYVTRFGSIGLHLVQNNGKIVPRGPRDDRVRRQVERMLLPEFRDAVATAGRK